MICQDSFHCILRSPFVQYCNAVLCLIAVQPPCRYGHQSLWIYPQIARLFFRGRIVLCIEVPAQRNVSWETTPMIDHLVLKDHIFLAEDPAFQCNWTCHQRPLVLRDQILMASCLLFQDGFYCNCLCGNLGSPWHLGPFPERPAVFDWLLINGAIYGTSYLLGNWSKSMFRQQDWLGRMPLHKMSTNAYTVVTVI